MTDRVDYKKASPGAYQAMLALEAHIHECGLEAALLELVKLRVSQVNGCAFCLAMHARLARRAGVDPDRLDTIAAWRESPYFSERERQALAWAEAVTALGPEGVSDAAYAAAHAAFEDKELVDLTLAVVAINGWNRLAIAFHTDIPDA